MAKKRKESTDEESEEKNDDFKFPEFSEAEFIKREKRNIVTLFLSFGLGLVMAVICFGFWALLVDSFLRWELVMLLGVVNASWLKWLFIRLKVDISDFTRKNWASSFMTYFLTWLLIFIVLVNPPFYDDEPPHVDLAELPGMQELGGTVILVAHIMDNDNIEAEGISLMIIDPDGTNSTPSFTYTDDIFMYSHPSPANLTEDPMTYSYILTAEDVNGHITTVEGEFSFSEEALKIVSSLPPDMKSGDVITIKADKEIFDGAFRVFYTIDDVEVNASLSQTDSENYVTTPERVGWEENGTQKVILGAEVVKYFINNPTRYSNTVRDTTNYTVSTSEDSDIGSEASPSTKNELGYSLPKPETLVATPGFEFVAVIAALTVCFVFLRKKDRK